MQYLKGFSTDNYPKRGRLLQRRIKNKRNKQHEKRLQWRLHVRPPVYYGNWYYCSDYSPSTKPPPQPTVGNALNTSSTSNANTSNGCSSHSNCGCLADDTFLPQSLRHVANTTSPPPSLQKKVQHTVLCTGSRFSSCTIKLQLLLLLPVTTVCANATNGNNDDTDIYVICGLVALIAAGGLMANRKRDGEANNDSNEVDEELGESPEGGATAAPVQLAAPAPGAQPPEAQPAAVLTQDIYTSSSQLLYDEVVKSTEPTAERAVDILTTLQTESSKKNPPITISILGNTKIGNRLTKTIKACKRHKVTASDTDKEQWDNAISIAETLLSSYKQAVEVEQSTTLPPNPSIESDIDTNSNSGMITMCTNPSGIDKQSIYFWSDDKNVTLEFVKTHLEAPNVTATFHYTPYSSKDNLLKKYPNAVINGDIVKCTDTNRKHSWIRVTSKAPLFDQVDNEEMLGFTKATLESLKYFRMANATQEDENNNNLSRLPMSIRTKRGQPCIECTCCGKHLFYSSQVVAEWMISNGLDKHLKQCEEFKKKLSTSEYKDFIDSCQLKSSHSTSRVFQSNHHHFSNVVRRLCRVSYGANPIIYNHQEMVEHARQVYTLPENKTHENHIPVHEILAEKGMETLIGSLLNLTTFSKNSEDKKNFQRLVDSSSSNPQLDFISNLFKKHAGVDVSIFRDDWDERFEKYPVGNNCHAMFIYTMRHKQKCCAKCGKKFKSTLFGNEGESNHIRADGALPGSEEANTKSHDITITTAGWALERNTWEFGETQIECTECHNHFGSTKPYSELPDEYFGKSFDDLNSIRMYSDVQESDECKDVHRVIDELMAGEKDDIEYDELESRLKVQRFNIRDISLFDSDEWKKADSSKRGVFVKQIEYYFEKRSTGGCFLCKTPFHHLATKKLCGLDGHHVDEESKDHNPAQSTKLSLEEGRFERSKCCPLCKDCHRGVHNVQLKSEQFDKMYDKSYTTASDGVIKRKSN